MTVEITLKDLEVTAEFDYSPAEAEVPFYSNGDYGHEGSPEEIDIYSIKYKDREMIFQFHDGSIKGRLTTSKKTFIINSLLFTNIAFFV